MAVYNMYDVIIMTQNEVVLRVHNVHLKCDYSGFN